MLNNTEIIILSLVQGVTEFLPISSSAHLILLSSYFEFYNQNLLIDICLHLGSLLAIIFYFRKDLISFLKNKKFIYSITVATLPIILIGFILYQTGLINSLRSIKLIAWANLLFGILLYISDKINAVKSINKDFSVKYAFIIGLFQSLSLISGVSRSGISITAGRFLGFNRIDSTKIAFLLSIPTLSAASFIGILNVYQEKNAELNVYALIAILLSFIFSYLTIKLFLNFIKKFSFNIFVTYRLVLSGILFYLIYFLK